MKKEGTISTCLACGVRYYRPPSNRGEYCSRACWYGSRPKTSALDRVLSRVNKPDGESGCWMWTGATIFGGYGCVRDTHRRVTLRVHRVVYEHLVGPIQDGMYLLHRCDTPLCCNPGHLFVGDAKDNSDDKIAKGRDRNRGESHHACKLSSGHVSDIRSALAAGESGRSIAARFRVSEGVVSKIKSGKGRIHG